MSNNHNHHAAAIRKARAKRDAAQKELDDLDDQRHDAYRVQLQDLRRRALDKLYKRPQR